MAHQTYDELYQWLRNGSGYIHFVTTRELEKFGMKKQLVFKASARAQKSKNRGVGGSNGGSSHFEECPNYLDVVEESANE